MLFACLIFNVTFNPKCVVYKGVMLELNIFIYYSKLVVGNALKPLVRFAPSKDLDMVYKICHGEVRMLMNDINHWVLKGGGL